MGDPVTAAAAAAAQVALKAATTYLATKLVEDSQCGPNMDNASLPHKTYCMVVRGLAGSDETEYKQRLNSQVDKILSTVTEINTKVAIINDRVTQLLVEMDLVQLKIEEVLAGSEAYRAIQEIQVKYGRYTDILRDVANGTARPHGQVWAEIKRVRDNELTPFFKDLLFQVRLYDKISTILNALVNPLPGKDSLLRNIVKQISIKGKQTSFLDCYVLYHEYTNAVLAFLLTGNLLVENAVKYCETLIENKQPNERPPFDDPLPFSRQSWKQAWNNRLETLFAGFNTHLEWFVLERSAEAAKGTNPFFLAAGARQAFRLADAFCCRHLGYGLRGRIFSMGGQFDGNLKFKYADTAPHLRPIGLKSTVEIGEKLDYWSATKTPGVYDKVDFSNEWTVHRFYIPNVATGRMALDIEHPYSPPAIDIGTIDEKTLQASDQLAAPIFGSFVETTRAGGAFAFLSGGWEVSREGDDEREAPIDRVAEYSNVSNYRIRAEGMDATVPQPEIGFLKGGAVYMLAGRSPGSAAHLDGSFRTWMQMTKTISFPQIDWTKEGVDVVVSLAPVEGGPEWANRLNYCLSWPTDFRPKQKEYITDNEVRSKVGWVGVDYHPMLVVTPSADTSAEIGVRLCSVEGGKNKFPRSKKCKCFCRAV